MPTYTPRIVDAEIDELMSGLAAVAIEGAKGVGKTASAVRRAKTVYRLDEETQRQLVSASPAVALKSSPPVLLDEWQRLPLVWDAVRRAVDEGAGRLGTNAPHVARRTRARVDLTQYATEIVASGFPGIRGLQGRARRAQLDGYLERVVNRDFHEAGHAVRKPDALRRWMTAYAAASATTTPMTKFRDAATSGDGQSATEPTILSYRDVLERLYVLDPLPGWMPSRNHLARLVQAPRHHLADPALAA
ncbi:MAG: hypothetical protein U0164_13345 [Gemmatimonadaceae bacterium]